MRAARFSQILLFGLCFCLATGAAFGQMSSDPTTVVVLDSAGTPINGTLLTYLPENGSHGFAQPLGNSTFVVDASNVKATLFVEHPTFGSMNTEVFLPNDTGALVTVYVDFDAGQAKVLHFDGLRDIIAVAEGGTDVIPPPGQGCQLPDQQPHGGAGYVAVVSDRTSPFIASDCFKPVNDGFLTHAVWWGAYVNIVFGLGTDCSPGPGDDFVLNYYDDGGGCPGNLIASFNVTLAQKFFTGNLLMGFANEYQFQSDFHAPVAVTGGECYYIEVSNNTVGDQDCFWLWSTAPAGDDASCQTDFNGDPQARDYDLAFCVNIPIQPDGCPSGPPASPDECDGCTAVSGEGPHAFDTSTATTGTQDQDNLLCDKFGSTVIDNDLWYCWTASVDCNATVSTCGQSAADTKIAVYDGDDCATATMVDCNDDTCGLQSEVSFTAVAGNTYLIRIGSFPGAAGGPGTFTVTCAAPPAANDLCDDAIAVAIGSTTAGSTIGMTTDAGSPSCGSTGITSPGVWYSVVGDGNTLTASVCNAADYDTKIHVFCGACPGSCIDSNDDAAGCGLTSELSWGTGAGVEYLILVSGFGGATGTFDLTVSTDGVPAADSCGLATGYNDVTIGSNVPNVFVQMSPHDVYLDTAGVTPFDRTFEDGTQVTVTAPTSWNGLTLVGFLVDGTVMRAANGGTLVGNVDRASHVKAIYGDDTAPSGGILHRR